MVDDTLVQSIGGYVQLLPRTYRRDISLQLANNPLIINFHMIGDTECFELKQFPDQNSDDLVCHNSFSFYL